MTSSLAASQYVQRRKKTSAVSLSLAFFATLQGVYLIFVAGARECEGPALPEVYPQSIGGGGVAIWVVAIPTYLGYGGYKSNGETWIDVNSDNDYNIEQLNF